MEYSSDCNAVVHRSRRLSITQLSSEDNSLVGLALVLLQDDASSASQMEDSALSSDHTAADHLARRLGIFDLSSDDDSLLGLAPGFLQEDSSSASQLPKMEDSALSSDHTAADHLARRLGIMDLSLEDDSLPGLAPGFLQEDFSSASQMEDSALSSEHTAADHLARRLGIFDLSSEDDSLPGLAPGFLQEDSSSASQLPKMEDLASISDHSAADHPARRLGIFDLSSDDDSLLGLAPGFLEEDSSSELQGQRDVDDNNSDGLCPIEVSSDPAPQPSKSTEPEMIRKSGKCNLRKSLPWDAFFMCEGLLSDEELSNMISDAKGQNKIPGKCDLRKSLPWDSAIFTWEGLLDAEELSGMISVENGPNQISDEKSSFPGNIMHSKNLTSNASPDSSFSDWSLESFSSSSGLHQFSDSSETSFSRTSMDFDKYQSVDGQSTIDGSVVSASRAKSALHTPKTGTIEESSDPAPQPSEITEFKMIRKSGKCKLRKSLPWDPAFSPSEGLLSDEELSNLHSVEYGQNKEVNRSTYSISTLRVTKLGGGTKEAKLGSQRKLIRKTISTKPSIGIQNPAKGTKRVSTCHRPQKSSYGGKIMPRKNCSSNISPASSNSDWSLESVSSSSSLQQFSRSSSNSFSRTSLDFEACRTRTDGSASRVRGSIFPRKIVDPSLYSTSRLRLPSPRFGFFD